MPDHDVVVGNGEVIVKMDIELMNTGTNTTDPGFYNAYFKSGQARFDVDGTFLPVLELRQGPSGNWVEQESSFYIEPMKKVQQTFFVRVPIV